MRRLSIFTVAVCVTLFTSGCSSDDFDGGYNYQPSANTSSPSVAKDGTTGADTLAAVDGATAMDTSGCADDGTAPEDGSVADTATVQDVIPSTEVISDSATVGQTVTPPAWCTSFDTKAVYLLGTLTPGGGDNLVARPTAPETFCLGFPGYNRSPKIRPSDGALLYIDGRGKDLVRQFVPDELVWDGQQQRWHYPDNAADNDPLVATSGCDSGDSGVVKFWIDPADGSLIYQCWGESTIYDGATHKALDLQGKTFVYPGANRTLLVEDGTSPQYPNTFALIDKAGALTWITKPAIYTNPPLIDHVRTVSDGLLVVVTDLARSTQDLWHVDYAGTVTVKGSYGDLPSDTVTQFVSFALDGDGVLYYTAHTKDPNTDVIVARPLAPQKGSVIFTEPASTPSWWNDPALPKVQMHGSELFTGP